MLDTHDGRAAVAPDRQRDGMAGFLRKFGHKWGGQAHRVKLLQADQAQLHGQRPQTVVAGRGVLLYQSQLAKTHKVGMRVGCCHVCCARQILERHGASTPGQCDQQPSADLHALDGALRACGFFGVRRGKVCHFRVCTYQMRLSLTNVKTIINRT